VALARDLRERLAHIRGLGGAPYSERGRRNAIAPDGATALVAIAAAVAPRTILELGTGLGASTLCFAHGCAADRIDSVEADGKAARLAAEHVRAGDHGDRVRIWAERSDVAIARIGGAIPFPELVFIDHEKSLYGRDGRAVHARMAGRGWVLVADNTTDRRAEMADFHAWVVAAASSCREVPTASGLIVARFGA